ncbi:TPA: hypothetical protein ACFJAY_001851, partial [Neisseria gonorrhoeae]
MSFIFLLPVQAPLRWGSSRIGTRCADELNYKRGHVQSQPFPQQNQRKMPSESPSDGIKKPPSLRLGGGRAILRTLFG